MNAQIRSGVFRFAALVMLALSAQAKPNFVVIFADDLGYGDLSCYGSKTIRTPNLDRMAAEGRRFTEFYAQSVCGPSRTALLTGCYPLRVATWKNRVDIMPPVHPEEITIAEMLKTAGYRSAVIGKWDLATHSQTDYLPELMPIRQGFDTYFGTPGSNDAIVNLLRDEELVEKRADMSTLTERYTDEAIEFIKRNKDKPFFLYLAHSMPHTRLDATPRFKGKSAGGLYGDVVEELDWHVGRLLDAVKVEGLDESTYVIFTSDNGPWFLDRPLLAPDDPNVRNPKGGLKYPFTQRDARGAHGGSTGPLRGAKTSSWEGGFRVPCIVRAPGRVPAGTTSDEVMTTLDFLPTFARLAGARVPQDRIIDGHDATQLLHGGSEAESPTTVFYYYQRTRLQAVRAGDWKLFVPHPADDLWSIYLAPDDSIDFERPVLYNLKNDIGERHDVAAQHPEVVERLLALAEKARVDIGDYDRIGAGARFFDPEPKRPDISNAKPVR